MSSTVEVPELGGEIEIDGKVKVRCIGCGQWVVLGEYRPDGKPIALHPLPSCRLFAECDLLTYVQTLRRYYEGN